MLYINRMKIAHSIFILFLTINIIAQDYFYKSYEPFDSSIPTPEEFFGYAIGDHHTRHDQMVAYLAKLAQLSDRAALIQYGQTFGHRKLVMLQIGTSQNISQLDQLREDHISQINPNLSNPSSRDLPVFINLGYNVHGNEPSGGEAALLTAYTMVASQHPDIENYRNNAVIFLDPVINPDGRDRHSHWVNMFKGSPVVADPIDVEHNEAWPRGRTNHYWFDLNRDWLLGINPESRGKLNWYHQWYPNVVTDFHEMGTNSSYFFEPMKTNGSKNPIMPIENYTTLNELFADEFKKGLDEIGSLYFTKDVFDGTYPGYGSSYPDLQGGLGILFEQASSRGHKQTRDRGDLTYAFTIRNQFVSSIRTIKASVDNKDYLQKYQKDFFNSALSKSKSSRVRGYVFGDSHDLNRNKAFLDKLLLHQIEVYKTKGSAANHNAQYYVPTNQVQYRMVQTMFETYDEFQDSVFYDASAWSLANFYNIPYRESNGNVSLGDRVSWDDINVIQTFFEESNYAYLLSWDDYNAPAFLYSLLDQDVRVSVAQKPFTIGKDENEHSMNYGALVIPVASQDKSSEELYTILKTESEKYGLQIISITSGYASKGIDLGSRYVDPIQKPKVLMLTHGSTSSYEAGEVWHLLDQRVHMPITKVPEEHFNRINLEDYNTLVLISGDYKTLDSTKIDVIKHWVGKGNTLITFRSASSWAIEKKLVKEELVKDEENDKESTKEKQPVLRKPYIHASEDLGQNRIGGIILEIDLDVTHPIAYGYRRSKVPVYRNSTVWLMPSHNPYSNVGLYTDDPHIDGFITKKNMQTLKKSASIIVSKIKRGRVILFAENPNFRGSWYGTNKLFLNGLFFGDKINTPE